MQKCFVGDAGQATQAGHAAHLRDGRASRAGETQAGQRAGRRLQSGAFELRNGVVGGVVRAARVVVAVGGAVGVLVARLRPRQALLQRPENPRLLPLPPALRDTSGDGLGRRFLVLLDHADLHVQTVVVHRLDGRRCSRRFG